MSRILLFAGIVAGPLFLVVWALQAFTRPGFRPTYHPLSLLSLGEFGWVQVANFVITGALYVAFAAGIRIAGRGRRWIPILIAGVGAGLVIAGVFVTDAGAGFPPGAPEGAGALSWHGILHEIGFVLTQVAFTALAIVLAVRFGGQRRWGWMVVCILAVVASFVIAAVGAPETLAARLVASSAIQFGLLTAIAVLALRGGLVPQTDPLVEK